MKTVTLGEVAELRAGVGFPPRLQGRSSGDFPLAKVGDISRVGRSTEDILRSADNFVDERDLAVLKMKPVPASSVLFAKIGEAIRQNHRVIAGRPMLIDNNAMAAIPQPDAIEPRYFFRFLQTIDFYALASSTTVPSLRKSDLKRIQVPLPPLADQRRIAAILDRADALRAKRRQVLGHLDFLPQSIFHAMFGHPQPSTTVGEVATVQGGLQVSSKRADFPIEIPYLRVANAYRGRLDLSEVKKLRATKSEIERTCLHDGDLLFVEGHANPLEVGRVAMWRGEIDQCVHQNHLIRGRFDTSQILPIVAMYWLNSDDGASHFRRAGRTTSGLNTISASTVRSAPLPLPPLSDQLAFADRVVHLGRQRAAAQRALEADDELFACFQSSAFQGDL